MTYPSKPLQNTDISELGWLTGQWRTNKDDELMEEHWTDVQNGRLLAMFRWIKSGNVFVNELMQIKIQGSEIIFALRHFSDDFIAWEEKENPIIMHLVEMGEQSAVFTRIDNPSGWFIYEITISGDLRFRDLNSDGTINFELILEKTG